MCKSNGESVDHLLLHFPVAMDLWSMVLALFGVSWVMPHTVLGLLGCWQGSFSRHRNGYIWSIVLHCLMWCLGGREIVDVLKILRDLFRISSYSFLKLYWIGCLLCKNNHSPLLLIS